LSRPAQNELIDRDVIEIGSAIESTQLKPPTASLYLASERGSICNCLRQAFTLIGPWSTRLMGDISPIIETGSECKCCGIRLSIDLGNVLRRGRGR
jgi:hypothetical protein